MPFDRVCAVRDKFKIRPKPTEEFRDAMDKLSEVCRSIPDPGVEP